MASNIEQYAMIGDTQTAALVGTDGSIDWLCVPRFDSGACFAALLGDSRHGRWRLSPAPPGTPAGRPSLPDARVLETEVRTDAGTVRLTDCMPVNQAQPTVVRIVEGLDGRV